MVAATGAARGESAKTLSRLARNEKFILLLFLVPAFAMLLCFYVYPLVSFLGLSIFDPDFTLEHYRTAFTQRIYANVLWETIELSALTTLGCLVLGYPIAFVMANSSNVWRIALAAFVLVPFWTNVLVRMYAWLVLLGRHGVINNLLMGSGIIDEPLPMMFNRFAVFVGLVHYMLPYMIIPIFAVMAGIPRALVDAATTLGANRYRAFWHVYFPLSLPGVGAACLLTFIITAGFFITPALLGGPKDVMLAQLIELEITESLDWPFGATLSAVLLAVTIAFYLIYDRLLNVERIYEAR